ncbi:hypothetical protein [Nocardiopsis sp. HUAS JQ3]|uniref:hypothetical protein n=1 Tax=Nocardiopsis sp. HUAS JQ3 TaxID=3061629 RepID=UPI0023A93ABA|nr:hypothetical protein [Nocardiopsis sp. HUAS JQ3]WDZ91169.1 hypothetical protein PV789_00905 [Nocardiopsis sp. HUAS JQ3]
MTAAPTAAPAEASTAALFGEISGDLEVALFLDARRLGGALVDLDELDALLSDAIERLGDLRGLIHAQTSRA